MSGLIPRTICGGTSGVILGETSRAIFGRTPEAILGGIVDGTLGANCGEAHRAIILEESFGANLEGTRESITRGSPGILVPCPTEELLDQFPELMN